MKTRDDFKLDLDFTLRDLVEDELLAEAADKKQPPQFNDASIDHLMQQIYAKVECEALATYHSNEPWALRQWCLTHILKDEVVNEATVKIADGIISDVYEWQEEQEFDPIKYYSQQLARKSEATKRVYLLTATRFVGIVGRKKHYTDEDILKYIRWLDKHYDDNSSYAQDCIKLTQFLRRLPDADRRRELPIDIPKVPKRKKYAHAFTLDELETLCWASVILNLNYKMVLRLVASTVYGRRVDELTNFKVNLDGENSTILFRVKKGGEEVPHPIPTSLVPLFRVPVQPISKAGLQRWLRQICDEIGITLPYRGGYHSIRRRVATLVKQAIKSDIDTCRFMRWADPRELSILAQYDQTRYEDIDKQVLSVHPVVKVWEEVMPYLLDMNKSYRSFCVNP